MEELQKLALHDLSDVDRQISGSIVCGNSYEQELEETAAHYLQRAEDLEETIREWNMKR